MMVSAYAARLRLTLAPDTVPAAADNGGELEAAIEVLGLIALKGKVVTADAARTAIAAQLQPSRKARRRLLPGAIRQPGRSAV